MARYDISIDTEYGVINLKQKPINRLIYTATLLGNQLGLDNDHYAYIEAVINQKSGLSYSINDSFLIQFKYHAINKPVMIRFLLENHNESKDEFMINKKDNSIWFPVLFNDQALPISEWCTINDSFIFELVFTSSGISIYSGFETDLIINAALQQNKNMLLLTRMGSLYQFPLTGVGLVDYLNSNFDNTDLADKLKSEFLSDGMVIIEASLNTANNKLNLIAEE